MDAQVLRLHLLVAQAWRRGRHALDRACVATTDANGLGAQALEVRLPDRVGDDQEPVGAIPVGRGGAGVGCRQLHGGCSALIGNGSQR
jgi:hypothetical protein